MGEDTYVRELKAGAVGAKLPTLLDLSPNSDKDFSGRTEAPAYKNYFDKDSAPKPNKAKTPEELSTEIAARIRKLHSEGRRLDEVYEALESEGYDYSAIEPVLIDFVNKNRPMPRPQMQANPAGVPKAPIQVQSMAAPNMQAPMQSAPRNFSATGSAQMMRTGPYITQGTTQPVQKQQQTSPGTPGRNLEVIDLNARKSNITIEEVPTNIQRTGASSPAQIQNASRIEPSAESSESLGGGDYAPLFVKVGKYRDVLETLNDLDNYLKAMARLFEITEELEKVRVMNISALDKMHKKALITSERLSSGLLKPKGMSLEGTRESDVELNKLGDVIGDLSKELSMLKKEVDKLSNIE